MALLTHNIDRANRNKRGFTLIESLIAAAILAIAVVGIAGTMAASSQQSSALVNTFSAGSLARDLLEEITAKPFDVPAGNTNITGFLAGRADRATYDNIDDFRSYWDTCTLNADGTITVANGTANTAVPTFARNQAGRKFQRSVSIEYRSTPNGAAVAGGDFAVVTVNVLSDHGEKVTLKRLFGRTTITR